MILITDENGKESSKISRMEFVFVCPQGKNIFSTFWLLICVSLDFIFHRFHQNNFCIKNLRILFHQESYGIEQSQKIMAPCVRATVEYLLSPHNVLPCWVNDVEDASSAAAPTRARKMNTPMETMSPEIPFVVSCVTKRCSAQLMMLQPDAARRQ